MLRVQTEYVKLPNIIRYTSKQKTLRVQTEDVKLPYRRRYTSKQNTLRVQTEDVTRPKRRRYTSKQKILHVELENVTRPNRRRYSSKQKLLNIQTEDVTLPNIRRYTLKQKTLRKQVNSCLIPCRCPDLQDKKVNRYGCSQRLSLLNQTLDHMVYRCCCCCGGVLVNIGPRNRKYPCDVCLKPVKCSQRGLQCDLCEEATSRPHYGTGLRQTGTH